MEFNYETGRIFANNEDGKTVAELTFSQLSDKVISINRTFVDDSLRGQGIAGKLMDAAASLLREQEWTAYPACSYAAAWFEKHPDCAGLRAEKPLA